MQECDVIMCSCSCKANPMFSMNDNLAVGTRFRNCGGERIRSTGETIMSFRVKHLLVCICKYFVALLTDDDRHRPTPDYSTSLLRRPMTRQMAFQHVQSAQTSADQWEQALVGVAH